jgi:hypothetical protein
VQDVYSLEVFGELALDLSFLEFKNRIENSAKID